MNRSDGILLVGAAHVDRYGRCDGPPVAGGSNPGRVTAMPGGAALNVASSLAALGADVRLCSILGNDAEADTLRAEAAARGIKLYAQVSAEHPTATYTSIVGPDGALAIALADMAIYGTFDPGSVEGAREVDWLLVDANLPSDVIEALLGDARGRTAAMTVSYAKAPRLRPALPRIDTVFTNRAELAALCERPADAAMEDLLSQFTELGGRGAVVTDGAAAVWTVREGAARHHPVPALPEIIDVTGAGDALTAGCLIALMANRSLDDAIAQGIRTAQAILAVHGPWRDDLSAAIL